MSNEDKRQRRKVTREEALEGGRILGAIAKSDPELYQAISSLAEEMNETPINVIVKSLKNYFLIQKTELTQMNVSQLLLAFDVFTRIAEAVTRIYTNLAMLFFSEMTGSIGEIIEKRVEERLKLMTPQGEVKKPSEIDVRLKSKLADILEGLVDEILRYAFRLGGLKIPESLKVKVPVELHIEEEKQEGVEVKVT